MRHACVCMIDFTSTIGTVSAFVSFLCVCLFAQMQGVHWVLLRGGRDKPLPATGAAAVGHMHMVRSLKFGRMESAAQNGGAAPPLPPAMEAAAVGAQERSRRDSNSKVRVSC